jgi:hypothetical protein
VSAASALTGAVSPVAVPPPGNLGGAGEPPLSCATKRRKVTVRFTVAKTRHLKRVVVIVNGKWRATLKGSRRSVKLTLKLGTGRVSVALHATDTKGKVLTAKRTYGACKKVPTSTLHFTVAKTKAKAKS